MGQTQLLIQIFVIFAPAEKNHIWWDVSHIQKTENLFLTKISADFTLKNRDP